MKKIEKISKHWIVIAAVLALLIVATVVLFSRSRDAEMIFDAPIEAPLTFRMAEYPGMKFSCDGYTVTAEMNGTEKVYIGGMPIRNLYLCDLNGDGKRELCATVSTGSGFIDYRIVVYDLDDDMQFQMEDRFSYNYWLTFEEGKLTANRNADFTSHPDSWEPTGTGMLTLSNRKLTMDTGTGVIYGKRSSPQINTDVLKQLFDDAASSFGSGAISRQVHVTAPVQYFLDQNETAIAADMEKKNDLVSVPLDVCADDQPLLQYLFVLNSLTTDYAEYVHYDPDCPDRIFVCTELRDCGYGDIASYYEALCGGKTEAHDDTFVVTLDQAGIYYWDSDNDLYAKLTG